MSKNDTCKSDVQTFRVIVVIGGIILSVVASGFNGQTKEIMLWILYWILLLPGGIFAVKTYLSNKTVMNLKEHQEILRCLHGYRRLLHDYRRLVFDGDENISKWFRTLSYNDEGYSLLRSLLWCGMISVCFFLFVFEHIQLLYIDVSE